MSLEVNHFQQNELSRKPTAVGGMKSPVYLSVVLPVFNEEGLVEELLQRLEKSLKVFEERGYEVVLVDDGSRDQTLSRCIVFAKQNPRVRVIELRRNYGQTAALQAGLDSARGEIIITMDADLQHFPEEIPAFVAEIEKGSDVVCGWRHERQEGIIRRWPSRAANWMLRRITGLAIHDIGTTFRAYRQEVVRDFRLLGENHRFVPVFLKMVGAKIVEIPIQNIERPMGKSNYGIGRTLNVFMDLFFLYFFVRYFDRPIRLFGRIGLLSGGGALAIYAALLAKAYWSGIATVKEHSGWFALGGILAIAAIQLILTGVIAEVLVRLYYNKGNDQYHVRRTWNLGRVENGAV